MSASYPSSAKTFTTKSNNTTADASHINDVQSEITAIETDLITAFPGGGAVGGQLKFPAVQNPSTNANTLDDYEEGSWTPVLGGAGGTSGQTYNTQVGTYIKIGKQVIASFNIILTAKGTITSSLQIQGLPFTAGAEGDMLFRFWQDLASNVIHMSGIVVSGGTAATIYINTAAATAIASTDTTIVANNTRIRGVCLYQASA